MRMILTSTSPAFGSGIGTSRNSMTPGAVITCCSMPFPPQLFSQYHRGVAGWYGIPTEMIPQAGVSIGTEARTDEAAERLLGIPAGTPISYRAGDQPNNAFSLNVMESGEVAATGGTSGVVYGVTDKRQADPQSRVNTFVQRRRHDRHCHRSGRLFQQIFRV